jgi:hypothetical protein
MFGFIVLTSRIQSPPISMEQARRALDLDPKYFLAISSWLLWHNVPRHVLHSVDAVRASIVVFRSSGFFPPASSRALVG